MFQIRTSVQVKNKDHARNGQAGQVWDLNEKDPTQIGVQFDSDKAVELVDVTDLVQL